MNHLTRGRTIASLAIMTTASLAGCTTQPHVTMPVNSLVCSHFTAGTVIAYQMAATGPKKAGSWKITSGRECSWTWPSEYGNGNVETWVNPPITLTTTVGKRITLPGTDETIFIEAGKTVKVAS